MKFTDPFDALLAKQGPPAIFTLSYEGELQLSLLKTRTLHRQNQKDNQPLPLDIEWCHCMMLDHATKWPYYALITAPVLCITYKEAQITRFDSYEEAIQSIEKAKQQLFESQKNS